MFKFPVLHDFTRRNFLSPQTVCFTGFILTKLNFYMFCQVYFSKVQLLHVITCKILRAASCFLLQFIFLRVVTRSNMSLHGKRVILHVITLYFSCNYA